MSLPDNGTQWPPAKVAGTLTQVREWSAWYSGDPDQLQTFYGAAETTGHAVTTRPSQYAGGLVGRMARLFWGTPVPVGEQRTKLHVPLAADIAGTSADLLFSEPVKLSGDNKSLQDALDDLADDGLHAELHQAGEVVAALGGGYLRTCWDVNARKLPWLDAVHPDQAVPEFRWGRLSAVTFWSRLHADGQEVWRLLERHEPGRILYGLYVGTGDRLGRIVPLTEHPDAADLATVVDEDSATPTGTDRLTASYVPNMLPNRQDRTSHQGRSDLQGVTPLLDALDEAYSSWWRDIRLGKARLHVPASYLESDGPGEAARLDLERELYVPVQTLAKGSDGLQIDAQQFTIRYAEHAQTVRDWANRAVQAAGYSVQTFGDTGDAAATATEVTARERRSYMTRGKKVRYWRTGLTEALQTLVEVANANLGAGIQPGDIKVEFGDAVQESQLSLAQTVQAISTAEAASTETKVRMLHPEWDDTAVQREVQAILGESGLPDPTDAGL